MRSMQLLIYRGDEQLLEVRARDFKTHWLTAVEVLDDDTYLGAEHCYNLFTLRKNSEAACDEDRHRLEVRLFGSVMLRLCKLSAAACVCLLEVLDCPVSLVCHAVPLHTDDP